MYKEYQQKMVEFKAKNPEKFLLGKRKQSEVSSSATEVSTDHKVNKLRMKKKKKHASSKNQKNSSFDSCEDSWVSL